MQLIKYLILSLSLSVTLSVDAEEVVDIIKNHDYIIYNKARSIVREFNISPQPGFDNLTLISASSGANNQFVMCNAMIFHPDGSLIQTINCAGNGHDVRILSPSIDARSGLRVEVSLQYYDNTQPTNKVLNYDFSSRFRFSDTVDTGTPPEPTEPTEPTEPYYISEFKSARTAMAPRKYGRQNFGFSLTDGYPTLIGFTLGSEYNTKTVSCRLHVIGVKTVDGTIVKETVLSANCNDYNRKLYLMKTPDNPTDFEHLQVSLNFQNRHSRNSAFASTRFTIIKGAIDKENSNNLPKWYIEYYNLPFNDPNDAFIDSDKDGYNNTEEYLGGSDPLDASSTPII